MTAPAMFEIVPFTTLEEMPEPENGPYYTLTKTGYMVIDRNMFGKYITPVKDIPTLGEIGPTLIYDIPKMPPTIIGQAYSFFKAIYERSKSEAMVDITWSEGKGYRLFVPKQRASGGGVQAERVPEHYKGQIVGTIHSHCNFNAFHSGTDTHDADGHDGLHITIGDVMKPVPSIAIMISKNGNRWDKLALDIVQDGPIVIVEHPKWWETYVGPSQPHNAGKHISNWTPGKPSTYPTGKPAKKEESKGKGKGGLVVVGGSVPQKTGSKDKEPRPITRTGRHMDIIDAATEAGVNGDKNIELLGQIEHELDMIIKILHRLNIDFDYDFGVVPTVWRASPGQYSAMDDDDDIPSQWRYTD